MDNAQIIKLMNEMDDIAKNQLKEIESFLCNENIKSICSEYHHYAATRYDIGFNLFKIFCKMLSGDDSENALRNWYYENNHSDFIKVLLDPLEAHNEGNKFLKLFLLFLNKEHKRKIDISNYENAKVTREKGKKDILIEDETTKKCIIIENKIRYAKDTHRQLPNYIDQMGMKNVDAVVYLVRDEIKDPERIGYENDDHEKVDSKLAIVTAYNDTDKDLYSGWILPCITEATNIDAAFVFRQYGKLLKQISTITMKNQIMEKLLEIILNEDKFKTATSIKNMLEELPKFQAQRLTNIFEPKLKQSPFQSVKPEYTVCRFRGFDWIDSEIILDIKTDDMNKFIVQFYDDTYYNKKEVDDRAKEILEKVDYYEEFNPVTDESEKYWYEKIFMFPKQENDMQKFVDLFNEKLLEFRKQHL